MSTPGRPGRVIAFCRPVDWWAVANLMPDQPETPVYPGSITASCAGCHTAIWVGPRQQAVANAALCCFECAAREMVESGVEATDIISLGNPYEPRS